jgi:DNA polymerase III subunit delta
MRDLSWNEIHKDLKNKVYYPVYLLMGEEPFYIDVISRIIEDSVLDETEKEFNQTVLYGRETDIPTIISTAKRFPMMANHQVVIVKEAQNVKDVEDLTPYFENPLKSTILVICYKYKSFKKNTKFVKKAGEVGVVMDSKKVYDNKMPEWISDYVSRRGYKIGPKATQMLADHLGNDLGKVVNEIKKIFISLPKGNEITPLLIEQNIGISKDFNVFELLDALGTKNAFKAFQIAKYFGDNPKSNPMVLTMGMLYNYFSKLLLYHSLKDKSRTSLASELAVPPFLVQGYVKGAANYTPARLIEIFSLLREYDVKSKGVDNVSADHGELLRELVYKILN